MGNEPLAFSNVCRSELDTKLATHAARAKREQWELKQTEGCCRPPSSYRRHVWSLCAAPYNRLQIGLAVRRRAGGRGIHLK